MTIQPWRLSSFPSTIASGSEQSAHSLGFTYYTVLPYTFAVKSSLLPSDVLQMPRELVDLIARNEPDPHWQCKMLDMLKKDHPEQEPAIPMMSSASTVMTLGFFAFKGVKVQENGNSGLMHLLTLQTDSLLNGEAPLTNPLGSFWLPTQKSLLDLLQGGRAKLHLEDFQVAISHSGRALPHDEVVVMAQTAMHQMRTKVLREEIDIMEAEVKRKQIELLSLEELQEKQNKKPRTSLQAATHALVNNTV